MATLFKNANLVDVLNETVISNASVLVENEIIKEIGTDLAAPADANVIDLGGKLCCRVSSTVMYICVLTQAQACAKNCPMLLSRFAL